MSTEKICRYVRDGNVCGIDNIWCQLNGRETKNNKCADYEEDK